MPDRADQLIQQLDLEAHPEGGHFREVFRADTAVMPEDARGPRSALTSIYFLLRNGERSRLHRVTSDEAWHFYEGDPLELFWLDATQEHVHRVVLGPFGEDAQPVVVVPAGCWQGARTTGAYTLAGCSVGPGFAFEDFMMIEEAPGVQTILEDRHPDLAAFL